ncbi:MAG: sel1 repeat family protein, partial [Candidatus Methanomethylophilaceae archaeon]|nr:sel1 repeat family protein [Candidatus Methanomethylophilaceae archaeon]
MILVIDTYINFLSIHKHNYSTKVRIRNESAPEAEMISEKSKEDEDSRRRESNRLYNLGRSYETGAGVPKSYEKAVKCYAEASEMGHSRAMHSLGKCYAEGKGVTKSYSEAVIWY